MSVYRIYVEKKPEFAVEANSLIGGIKSALGLENLTGLRVINRYFLSAVRTFFYKIMLKLYFLHFLNM